MPECSAQAVGTSLTCVIFLLFFLAHVIGFDCLVTKGIVQKVAHQEEGGEGGGETRCARKAKHKHDTSGEQELDKAGGKKKMTACSSSRPPCLKIFL